VGSNWRERDATKWRAAGVSTEARSSLTGAKISMPSDWSDLLMSCDKSLSVCPQQNIFVI
jgi:hypothetical protein